MIWWRELTISNFVWGVGLLKRVREHPWNRWLRWCQSSWWQWWAEMFLPLQQEKTLAIYGKLAHQTQEWCQEIDSQTPHVMIHLLSLSQSSLMEDTPHPRSRTLSEPMPLQRLAHSLTPPSLFAATKTMLRSCVSIHPSSVSDFGCQI